MSASALDRILAYKREEVAALKSRESLASFERRRADSAPFKPRGFIKSIRKAHQHNLNALICELKRKSPSAGDILPDADRIAIAAAYENGGAACLSILTDGPSFGGSLDDLATVRKAVSLPCLRKEFMIDPIQVAETAAYGADAILIIMAAVDDGLARDLASAAEAYDLDVLAEVHNHEELERALALETPLIGVNNRDLTRMVTDLATTEQLAPLVPTERILISESGIRTPEDIKRLTRCGARTFLIGESLMKSGDPEKAVEELSHA